jgi:hypothetical protein
MNTRSLPSMAVKRPELGQKNFALGGAKAVFERWCVANGYDEKKVFLAGVLALQDMRHPDRARYFRMVEAWATKQFESSDEGVATVVNAAESRDRPVEKTPSRESRRASA